MASLVTLGSNLVPNIDPLKRLPFKPTFVLFAWKSQVDFCH
jgi:hypothetical protein